MLISCGEVVAGKTPDCGAEVTTQYLVHWSGLFAILFQLIRVSESL